MSRMCQVTQFQECWGRKRRPLRFLVGYFYGSLARSLTCLEREQVASSTICWVMPLGLSVSRRGGAIFEGCRLRRAVIRVHFLFRVVWVVWAYEVLGTIYVTLRNMSRVCQVLHERNFRGWNDSLCPLVSWWACFLQVTFSVMLGT
jgi:hypothetical protein